MLSPTTLIPLLFYKFVNRKRLFFFGFLTGRLFTENIDFPYGLILFFTGTGRHREVPNMHFSCVKLDGLGGWNKKHVFSRAFGIIVIHRSDV